MRLDEDVDHIAVLVDATSEILALALDVDEEVPNFRHQWRMVS